MSFDYLILVDGKPAPDLVDLAASVTVEQSLDDSARFTLRLEVDLASDGQYTLLMDDRVRPGAEISVLVRDGESTVCLVQGPVDRARVHIARGGAGSWLEVMGGDRRVVMDRLHRTAVWPGLDSDIVRTIVESYGLDPDITDTEHSSDAQSHTQNQSATDLAWVQRLARRNGFHFWLSYEVDLGLLATTVKEIAHFKPSPPRPELSSVPGGGLLDLLPGGGPPRLEINLAGRDTETMASIDIEIDAERPTQIEGLRVAEADTLSETTNIPAPPHEPLGALTLKDLTPGVLRSMFLTTAGDAAELRTRANAALAEAERFVRATARCSRYSLQGRVLQPHMVDPVVGLGERYSGDYFVTSVTHTIDANVHTMDVELARNALGA